MSTKALGWLLCAGLTSGCAIHPLPENVARLDTFSIVGKIRCEARGAIQKAAIYFLTHAGDPIALEDGEALANGTLDFADIRLNRYAPRTQFFVNKYEKTAIAYDFEFNITEDNDASAEVDLLSTFTRGTLSAPIKARNDRTRQTVRNFRVSDKFGDLRRYRRCGTGGDPSPNYIYPITGTIGLAEVVTTFIDLNENQNLAPPEKATVPVLADTFHFQTIISGSITPTLTLTPLNPKLDITGANAMLGATRTDIHQVIVALSLEPDKSQPPAFQRVIGVVGGLVSPHRFSRRSPAEQRALDELDNQVQRRILNRLVVTPN